ncbi:MAG: Rossmann-like and DUF2520 domain-containing protein [bacterium]
MTNSNDKLGPVAIIGAGRVGRALSQAFYKQGIRISAVISRSLNSAEKCAKACNCSVFSEQLFDLPDVTKTIFVTTPDRVLPNITRKLAKLGFSLNNKFIAHTSGVMTSEVLEPLKVKNALVACFHPIQTFAGDEFDWEKLSGIYFGIEGDSQALSVCKSFVKLFGGKYIIIPKEKKTLYHAACVFTSNYLVALMTIPVRLLNSLDPDKKEETAKILLPLLEGTVDNIKRLGIENALTGPISRGDVETVQEHVEILKREYSEIFHVYCLLGKQALEISEKREGMDGQALKTLQEILQVK